MTERDSFAAWMGRLRAGEDGAAREVFRRYTGRLIALARRRLGALMRAKVDPEDVVQSAYKSFFARYGDGQLAADNWNGLWGLLTLITLRKCADRVEYHRAGRRDARREEAPAAWWEAPGREPTPHEAAVLAETVEALLRGLDEDERPVVELSLQGYSTQEISERLGRAERSVRRLRERVKKRLEQLQQAGEGS
jgi:RNA polymerase sigma-70 factor (ECF subfamily)